MHKYLWRKGRARTHGRKTSHQLQNGVPCKLDVRGNAILDPLTQPIAPKNKKEDEVDPASVDQPFFVIKGHNGTNLIYREDSVKNLMNNSVVRYNDPTALEVSNLSTIKLNLIICYRKQRRA